MATHSRILAWDIPWTGVWGATVQGKSKESGRTELLNNKYLSYTRRYRDPYHQKQEIRMKSLYKQTLLNLNLLSQAQILFRFFSN